MQGGKIVRSRVDEVRITGRNTQGVRFAKPDAGDAIIAVARGADAVLAHELEQEVVDVPGAAADPALPATGQESPVPPDPADGVPSEDADSGGEP